MNLKGVVSHKILTGGGSSSDHDYIVKPGEIVISSDIGAQIVNTDKEFIQSASSFLPTSLSNLGVPGSDFKCLRSSDGSKVPIITNTFVGSLMDTSAAFKKIVLRTSGDQSEALSNRALINLDTHCPLNMYRFLDITMRILVEDGSSTTPTKYVYYESSVRLPHTLMNSNPLTGVFSGSRYHVGDISIIDPDTGVKYLGVSVFTRITDTTYSVTDSVGLELISDEDCKNFLLSRKAQFHFLATLSN